MRRTYSFLGTGLLTLAFACSGGTEPGTTVGGGTSGNGDGGTSASGGSSGGGPSPNGGSGGYIDFGDAGCPRTTCEALGWECGYTVDVCGNVVDCADEGLSCGSGEVCVGGIDGPTQCQAGGDDTCELCSAVPECDDVAQPTRLTGRVITPGRDDANTENQVGVPNAVVYILKTADSAALPDITPGIPVDGQSCDRCEEQDLGPLLAGAITDAEGNFAIEGRIPVGVDFSLVVKAGKFRRVVTHALSAESACISTALPTSLTRLPRNQADGLKVNIPKIAVTTGSIDAMECVFYKMGLDEAEFGVFGQDAGEPRVHLYRGGPSGNQGAKIEGVTTPPDVDLYDDLTRLDDYDMVVSDCEGTGWDSDLSQRGNGDDASQGGKVRQYVNRGGRMFMSHLSFSWLHENRQNTLYDASSNATAWATGLGQSSTWSTTMNTVPFGTGVVSLVGDPARDRASPRIQSFADWMENEGVTSPDHTFRITDPRSQNLTIAPGTEEFVYRADSTAVTEEDGYASGGNGRVQQFSFNTPFGAPTEAACGRVAYSGFHVAATSGQGTTPYNEQPFPQHCTSATLGNDGNLTSQEKVLLYMLFDLGACVGDEPIPPPCVPITCTGSGVQRCGYTPDGCGNVLDCGPCRPPA